MLLQQKVWGDKNLIKILKDNGVVIMPTDTLYGVVGKALCQSTVDRIYRLRKRNPEKPCIILVGDKNELKKFGIVLTKAQRNEIGRYKEPMSFILDCANEKFSYLYRGTNSLAFRVPASPALRNLLIKVGPLIAPSANPEGLSPAQTISEARRYFGDSIDLYLDAGKLAGKASKVIKLHKDGKLSIIRQ